MLILPTRRELISYGVGTALFSKLSKAQALFRTQNVSASSTPITLGNHTKVSGANGGTTPSIDTTGATLLVIGVSGYESAGAPTAVSDSKSNTWTPLTSYPGGVGPDNNVHLFYAANPTVGTGHTFTSANATFSTIYVAAFNNVKTTSPFDNENGQGSGASSTLQPGSITPTVNNDLVVTVATSSEVNTPITINSSFVVIESQFFSTGVYEGGALAYIVQTTASAVNPTWTSATANINAASIASFKAP